MFLALVAAYLVLPIAIAAWHMHRWWRAYRRPVVALVAALGLGFFLAAIVAVCVVTFYSRVAITGVAPANADYRWLDSPDTGLVFGLVILFLIQWTVLGWMRQATTSPDAKPRI